MRLARSKLCYLFSPFVLINIFLFVRFSHKQWKGGIFKATSRMNLSMIQNITIVQYKHVLLRSAVPAKYCPSPKGLGNISVNVTSAEANYWKESDIQAPNLTANGTSSFLGIPNGNNDTVANKIVVFQPMDCENSNTVAIIIPFRDRESHLRILLGHLVPILRQQLLRYSIFVMEQVGDATFNKGRLMNTGFEFASAVGWRFRVPYDCFIFQDVDLLVEHISLLYRCQKGVVTHLSTTIDKFDYKPLCCGMTVGGVVGFGEQQFRKVNGYPNSYWGWGGEDDDINKRIRYQRLKIIRPKPPLGRYAMIKHERDKGNPFNGNADQNLRMALRRIRHDGLSNLDTRVMSVENYPLFTKILVDVGSPS